MDEDFTIAEAATDPLIGQLLKADGIPQRAFDQLLQSAARLRENALKRAIEPDGDRMPSLKDEKRRV